MAKRSTQNRARARTRTSTSTRNVSASWRKRQAEIIWNFFKMKSRGSWGRKTRNGPKPFDSSLGRALAQVEWARDCPGRRRQWPWSEVEGWQPLAAPTPPQNSKIEGLDLAQFPFNGCQENPTWKVFYKNRLPWKCFLLVFNFQWKRCWRKVFKNNKLHRKQFHLREF